MDIPIEQDMDKKKELKTELFNIRTIDLSSSAKNIAEKILWASIAILGTIWIGSIGMSQMNFWNDNPVLVTKGARSLADLNKPTITLCHKGMQKFGFVERMANYIDTTKEIPKEVFEIRNLAIKAQYLRFRQNQDIPLQENFCRIVKYSTVYRYQFPKIDMCEVRVQGVRVPFFTFKKLITQNLGFSSHGLVKPKCV